MVWDRLGGGRAAVLGQNWLGLGGYGVGGRGGGRHNLAQTERVFEGTWEEGTREGRGSVFDRAGTWERRGCGGTRARLGQGGYKKEGGP